MKIQNGRAVAYICLALSGLFVMTGLYQIEVIEWQKYLQYPTFAWPFGFRSEFWLARDIFYAFIIGGWILCVISASIMIYMTYCPADW